MPEIDVVGDIHGDNGRLSDAFSLLGRNRVSGEDPGGRPIVFLGDLIDRGPSNRAVIRRVFNLVREGRAQAVMGNHELNAILFATVGFPDKFSGLSFMRRHSQSALAHHSTFLEEFPIGSADSAAARRLFMSMPLFIERDGARFAHAHWDDAAIAEIRSRRADGRLREEDLQEVAFGMTDFAKAVNLTCKGPEVRLPEGFYHDSQGSRRRKVRLRWWLDPAETIHQMAAFCGDLSNIPDGPAPEGIDGHQYSPAAPILFFGHYSMPEAQLTGHNAVCLDIKTYPVAYRWRGEPVLDPANLYRQGMVVPDILEDEECGDPEPA